MADYLKDDQHYIDRYDLHTIETCLDYYNSIKKSFEEKRGSEEFKKYTNKAFDKEVQKVLNVMVNTIKGERFKNKAKTIQEWVDKDRREQEKYDGATPPAGIVCKECNAPTKVAHKDLHDSYKEDSKVVFMFRCIKCNKGQAFYEDGTEWIYDPPKCPKCSSPLNSDYKDVDEVMTTTWSRPNCSYKKEDIYDFKKSRLEREEQEAKDKKLLDEYREAFCLTDEKGQEYIEMIEAMEVGEEVYKEELQKYGTPVYERATQLKELSIIELEKLLTEKLEKEKFVKLSLDKPEMGIQVIVPFTVQDIDSSRRENISTADLKKLLKDTLENTNWRLMSDGVHYRLGYLYGQLKGYEGEEAMLDLAGKKKEETPKVESEKRMKYNSNSIVQIARLSAEVKGEENLRKKRLIKEPKGFPVPEGKTYSCHVCLTSINSSNGWYHKYGFKCLDCQKAADEGILPPEVFEDDHSWYTDWHIESEFGIPDLTIKKLVKEGYLKPRIVKTSTGRDHRYVFMALENNDLLEAYVQKHKIILLCGIPASGKSKFGKYLQKEHGYTYVPMEDEVWPDINMRSLWNNVFEAKRQYNAVEKFVCYLHDNYENVVLEWGFPMNQIEVVGLLKRQWCEIIWFSCSVPIARKRFIKRNKNSTTYFDNQIKSIEENNEKIIDRLDPKVIYVLKDDKTDKTMEELYSEYSALAEY